MFAPKNNKLIQLFLFAFTHVHPDAVVDHPEIREWELRKEEVKQMETKLFNDTLQQKWDSYPQKIKNH